jgi:hypothetical protein
MAPTITSINARERRFGTSMPEIIVSLLNFSIDFSLQWGIIIGCRSGRGKPAGRQ